MKTNTTFSISSVIKYNIFGGIVNIETFASNEDAVAVFIGKVSDLAKEHGHDAIDTIEEAYEWLSENEQSLEVSYSLQASLLNNKEGLLIEDYEMLASEIKFMGDFLSKLGYSEDEISEIANTGILESQKDEEKLEKFECDKCSCYFHVKSRDGFECPNCESIEETVKPLRVLIEYAEASDYLAILRDDENAWEVLNIHKDVYPFEQSFDWYDSEWFKQNAPAFITFVKEVIRREGGVV